MLKKLKSAFFFIIILGCGFNQRVLANNLISIINPDNKGDSNQILGVSEQIQSITNHADWSAKEISFKQLDELKPILKDVATDKDIVISSGTYGIDVLRLIQDFADKKPLTVHLSHQILADHNKLIRTSDNPNGVDIIVLPKHVITDSLRKEVEGSSTKLIETIGVCHNVNKKEVEEEFTKYKSSFPEAKKYLVVILGGDAQMPDGTTWLKYKESEVKELAVNVLKRAKQEGSFIIVLNGPRTGKHNKEGEVDTEAHKTKMDHITAAFMKECESQTKNIKLFDFQSGKPSLYKATLGAVLSNKGSEIWVPGESTSMVSEAIYLLDNVLVYEHSAMNETHKAHINSEFTSGSIKLLKEDGSIKTPKSGVKPHSSAASNVAKEILKTIKLK